MGRNTAQRQKAFCAYTRPEFIPRAIKMSRQPARNVAYLNSNKEYLQKDLLWVIISETQETETLKQNNVKKIFLAQKAQCIIWNLQNNKEIDVH